ncbi:hypothetical protein M8J76_016867 [Diaphorina citri]|nr:hypothetical protein M8J76_016867 [Diaphorina citri]
MSENRTRAPFAHKSRDSKAALQILNSLQLAHQFKMAPEPSTTALRMRRVAIQLVPYHTSSERVLPESEFV